MSGLFYDPNLTNEKSLELIRSYLEAVESVYGYFRIRCVSVLNNGIWQNALTTIHAFPKGSKQTKTKSRRYNQLNQLEEWVASPELLPFLKKLIETNSITVDGDIVQFSKDFCICSRGLLDMDNDYSPTAGWYYIGEPGGRGYINFGREPLTQPRLPSYTNQEQAVQDWVEFKDFHGSSDSRRGGLVIFLPELRAYFKKATFGKKSLVLEIIHDKKALPELHLSGMLLHGERKVVDISKETPKLHEVVSFAKDTDGFEVSLTDGSGNILVHLKRRAPYLAPSGATQFGGVVEPFGPPLFPAQNQSEELKNAKPPLATKKRSNTFETSSNTYKRIRQIGEGGNGRVFEVTDQDGVTFALKVANYQKLNSERRKRLKNEITFCRNNAHGNVITIVDEGYVSEGENKVPFYVMKKYDTTLRALMKENLSDEQKVKVFLKMLDGVEAGHLKNVFHRDLKPENILYNQVGEEVVVADFGIAHFAEEHRATSVKTKEGSKLLNMGYSAPEQRHQDGIVDHRADIFALGSMLNELFTGKVPDGAKHKTVADASPAFSYLDDIVDRMRAQDPNARYQTIDEVKKELIARKLDFVQRQKIHELENTVVPVGEFSHHFIKNPVQIVDVEHLEHVDTLCLKFDQQIPHHWDQLFLNPRPRSRGFQTIPGYVEPHLFHLNGDSARITLRGGGEQILHSAIQLAKDYVDYANESYVQYLKNQHLQRLEQEKKEIARRIRVERTNLELRKTLKGTT